MGRHHAPGDNRNDDTEVTAAAVTDVHPVRDVVEVDLNDQTDVFEEIRTPPTYRDTTTAPTPPYTPRQPYRPLYSGGPDPHKTTEIVAVTPEPQPQPPPPKTRGSLWWPLYGFAITVAMLGLAVWAVSVINTPTGQCPTPTTVTVPVPLPGLTNQPTPP